MTCEKVTVEHGGNLTTISMKIGHDPTTRLVSTVLTRSEAEGLRQRLVPPEGQRRLTVDAEIGRLYDWLTGRLLSDGDVRDLRIVLQALKHGNAVDAELKADLLAETVPT